MLGTSYNYATKILYKVTMHNFEQSAGNQNIPLHGPLGINVPWGEEGSYKDPFNKWIHGDPQRLYVALCVVKYDTEMI